jgi:hypothetical protein
MRRSVTAAATVAAWMLGACTSFSSSGGGGPDAGDAAAVDGPIDAAPDSGLLTNGDFEVGCEGWTVVQGSSTGPDPTAHSGNGSCRVCSAGTATMQVGIFQKFSTDITTGDSFAGSAWMRAAEPDAAPPGTQPTCRVDIFALPGCEGGMTCLDQGLPTAGQVLGADWQQVNATVKSRRDGGLVDLELRATTTTGCFLVDDAALFRNP